MEMKQAANFLGSSILIMLGIIIVIVGIVVINNILHKYWKPVNIFTPESWRGFNPPTIITYHTEKNEHTTDNTQKK